MLDFMNMAGNYSSRKVARDETPTGFISTARVTDGVKPFETAVQDSRYRQVNGSPEMVIVKNYNTIEEAQQGHMKWLKLMTKGPLPQEIPDCGNGLYGMSALCEIKYILQPQVVEDALTIQ